MLSITSIAMAISLLGTLCMALYCRNKWEDKHTNHSTYVSLCKVTAHLVRTYFPDITLNNTVVKTNVLHHNQLKWCNILYLHKLSNITWVSILIFTEPPSDTNAPLSYQIKQYCIYNYIYIATQINIVNMNLLRIFPRSTALHGWPQRLRSGHGNLSQTSLCWA